VRDLPSYGPPEATAGEYMFHVDLEGHRLDPAAGAALDELAQRATWLRVVGSYPVHGRAPT
jgi:chorismate mutase/prephenate dehydratase